MSNELKLTGMTGVSRAPGAPKIYGETSSQVVGYREGYYRLERYTLAASAPITSIEFKFLDVNSHAFQHDAGADLRSEGICVFVSTSKDMSDWENFSPDQINWGRGGLLSFNSARTELSGTINLSTKLDPGTYYIFFYSKNDKSRQGYFYWTNNSKIEPINESTYSSYSQPGAPTSLEFTETLGNGKLSNAGFTINWEGATTGLGGNTIAGYEIKFSWEEGVVWVEPDATTYTYVNSAEGYVDGQDIEVSVRAVGVISGFEYSEWTIARKFVNTLPFSPSLGLQKNSTQLFKRTSEEVINFTFSPDYDQKDLDGESVSCYYQQKRGNTWSELIQVEGPFTVSITDSTDFRFCCYDGYEYSEFVEQSLQIYSLLLEETPVRQCQQGEKKSITKTHLSFDCLPGIDMAPYALIVITFSDKKEIRQIVDTNNDSVFDIIKERMKLNAGFGYSFSVFPMHNNSTGFFLDEDENELDIASNDYKNRTLFAIPTRSTTIVLDQHGNENICNKTIDPCFFSKVRVKLPPFDSQILEYDNYLNFNGKNYRLAQPTLSAGEESNEWIMDAEIPAVKLGISGKTLSLTLSRGEQKYEIDLGVYRQIPEFVFENLQISSWSAVIPVYDQTSLIFKHAFSKEMQDRYALSEINGSNASFQVGYGSNKANCVLENIKFTEGTSTQSYSVAINKELFDSLNVLPSDYFGSKELVGRLGIKNKYGHTVFGEFVFGCNFDKSPEIQAAVLGANDITTETRSLMEGMTFTTTCQFKFWSYTKNLKARVVALTYEAEDSTEQLENIILLESPLAEFTNNYEGQLSESPQYVFKIPALTEKQYWCFQLQIVSESDVVLKEITISDNSRYTAFPITAPTTLQLNKVEALGNGKYQLEYVVEDDNSHTDDNSYTLTREIYLAYQGNTETVKALIDKDKNAFFEDDPLGESNIVIMSLQIEDTYQIDNYQITKIWISNTQTVYGLLPTVSYRKNKLLINSKIDEEGDSVIYINRASNAHYVRLKLQNEGGTDLGDLTIDLHNGAVNNSIIDCGSWDGTSGGIVPTPELPTGLAAIAYSGDIADLQQNKNVTIILSGGSAPTEEI